MDDSNPLVDYVEWYQDDSGEFRWRARAGNNETVADSGEGYVSRTDCLEVVARMYPGIKVKGPDD